MKYATFAPACALVVALMSSAHAHEGGEPTGVGDLKFGMSPDAVKKLYPSLELVSAAPPPAEGNIQMSVYRLQEQKLGKLACNIEMKFLVDRLSYLDFYCGEKEDIPAYLETTYGQPTMRGDTGWQWQGKTLTISYSPVVGTFTVALKRANDALQGNVFLYGLMQGEQPQGQPAGQGQPAPAQK